MIHLVFFRATNSLKVFGAGDVIEFEASGDAWGNYHDGERAVQYGHDGSIAPGHYLLTRVEEFPPIPSEGAAQIYVADLDDATLQHLLAAGKATITGDLVAIGGIELSRGGLGRFGRSEVMLHGGGSNLGEPECFAPHQPLCRTFGCTRLHNDDLATLCALLKAKMAENVVVFSCIGDPEELPE